MTTTEVALVESRALRASVIERTEGLDKVKPLVMLPDGMYVTTRMLSNYFEVREEAIRCMVADHREELESNGYRVVDGEQLRVLKTLSGIRSRTPALALFNRRAALNVAMLLRDSEVARRVRIYLLDAEEAARTPRFSADRSLDQHVADVAQNAANQQVGALFAELSTRLDAQTQVVGAMSVRLADIGSAVSEIRRDVAVLRAERATCPQPQRRKR